jgi:hypothetical protein
MSIDTKAYRNVGRTGRQELIERIHALCDELDRVREDLDVEVSVTVDLEHSLAKATAALQKKSKVVEGGLTLPGWFCPGCGVFNGEAKTILVGCRCCDTKRPGGLL